MCGGTSFIYKKNSDMTYMSNKIVNYRISILMYMGKLTLWKDSAIIFTPWNKRPKEVIKEDSSLKAIITISKSPSKIAKLMLISRENSSTLTAAKASNSTTDWGKEIFWDMEAITVSLTLSSLIITPISALYIYTIYKRILFFTELLCDSQIPLNLTFNKEKKYLNTPQ